MFKGRYHTYIDMLHRCYFFLLWFLLLFIRKKKLTASSVFIQQLSVVEWLQASTHGSEFYQTDPLSRSYGG